MSVTISSYQTVQVPLGMPLAKVNEVTGDLSIYPEGYGYGPVFTMSITDWEQIKHSADAAIRTRRQQLGR